MGTLLLLSAFFSGSETALFSLNPETARRLRSNRRIQGLLAVLQKDPTELLSAILLGNLLVNILFFCSGAVIAGRWGEARGDWFEALGGLLILLAVILFGEIVPKAVGITHAPTVLRIAAGSLQVWFRITRIFRKGIRILLRLFRQANMPPVEDSGLTSGELRELLDAVHHEPGFGLQEKEILEDIVNLSDVRVREIMTPRIHVERRPLKTGRQQLLQTARQHQYSRILVYGENDDDLLGYIRIREILLDMNPALPLEAFLHTLEFIPETKRADILLQSMMASNQEMVAVVDEYGGLAGIVTVEDLLAEVVGDFETAVADDIQKLDDFTYRINGQLSIREWRELFTGFLRGQELDSLAFDTLGGLIVSLLGRMPQVGDSVTVRNLHLTVETMHHRRVDTVLLHLNGTEGGK